MALQRSALASPAQTNDVAIEATQSEHTSQQNTRAPREENVATKSDATCLTQRIAYLEMLLYCNTCKKERGFEHGYVSRWGGVQGTARTVRQEVRCIDIPDIPHLPKMCWSTCSTSSLTKQPGHLPKVWLIDTQQTSRTSSPSNSYSNDAMPCCSATA